MYIVIAMAGEGRRFREYGIAEPKYEIVARGKPLFDWALLSLQPWFEQAHFVFVARSGAREFVEKQCVALRINSHEVVELSEMTDGQATTVLKGIAHLEPNKPLLIYNIDTHIVHGVLNMEDIGDKYDGWLVLFRAPGDHWSFAKLDESGRVTEVSEKVRISDFASVGLYYFKSVRLFREVYQSHARWVKTNYKEVYVMPLYKALLDKGLYIGSKVIAYEEVVPLGTPEEVSRFDPKFKLE